MALLHAGSARLCGGVPGVTSGAPTVMFLGSGFVTVFWASGVTPLLFLVWWSSDIIRLTLLFVVACDGSRWARSVWLS